MQSAKQKTPSDDEVLKKLCVANGLSYDQIVEEGGNVESLEMFFSGFPRMVGLSFFPKLGQLTVVDQKVTRIQGLECCPLLKELWVVQCHLTEICGLQNCTQLEKLYLYNNQISEIKNLEPLVNLQILWLNNNCITKIEGLATLKSLKVLNLADNRIEKIEDSLHPNRSLFELNLSGNKISSFKELTLLAHLPNLVDLALQDRASVPNPVCLLYNYATHVLYHMPGLKRLDNYDVSRKLIKESTESAVMKKKMYYNMRMRTAQRNLAEIRLSLIEKKKALSRLPEERIKTLSHTLKSLEHELSVTSRSCRKSAAIHPEGPLQAEEGFAETSASPSDTVPDSASEATILLRTEALKERLSVWTRRLDEIEACFESDLAQATNRMDYTVQFLLMELESVGNIRLEEGNPTDLWFASCRDLLLSRFAPSDYKVHGIVDLKVNGVIRVNNNALRVRFEEKVHGLIADDNSPFSQKNYRQQLDYLFYMPDPERCEKEETLRILEEGFKAEPLKALGGEVAIPLSDSLSVIEQPRIEHALEQASRSDNKKGAETIPFRHGQVVLSKVFVGNSRPLRDGKPLDRRSCSTAFSVCRRVDTQPSSVLSQGGPGRTKSHECNLRRTQWFMFDHELILPEYIIYFEYITADKGPSLLNLSTDRETSSSVMILDEEVLNMEPALKPRAERLSLDSEFLCTVARANLLSQITVLNLHGSSLSRIKEIASLRALRRLTLSFNRLTRLDDISHMPNLEFLDVSFNELLTLEGLRGLGQLKQLDLRWNQLTKAREDASVLQKHAPALLKLDTRNNPWNRPQSVRMTVLGQLPALTHLDEELVSEEEAAEAVGMAAGSKINQATLQAHSRTDSERPHSLSLLSTAQLVCQLSPSPCLCSELVPGWAEKITTLNLDNVRITQMISLSELVNLRWASFNDNEISNVEGLDSCVKLEELSLNNNSISTLNGLTRLHCLRKLSVDENLLSSLDSSVLDQLPSLSFLSLEKNCIASLRGIQRLRSLLELYIGSNQISTSSDIFYLKGLDNLIILDLYGNPLVKNQENYRMFVVFHLPSIKALDGVAVELGESDSAENMFRGRLSTDTIAEKLGHSNYTTITHLKLQSCSIRRVDLSPAALFCNLRSVTLDHNNLTSFSGLVSLPNVQTLSLNYNTIESVLPVQKTQAHLTNRQRLNNKVQSSGYGLQGASRVNRDAGPSGGLEPLMESLEVLHLSHNGISNMANLQLSRLTNLRALFLEGNEISQVEGLEGLDQLRELVLDQNRIKVLAKNSFTAQRLLIELSLTENRIRELSHLDSLPELRRLYLDKNKLQDIAELEKLKALPSLEELSVVGNPAARNSLHRPAVVRALSQLQVLDNVVVTLDERTMAELPPKDQSPCLKSHIASLPPAEINPCGLLPFAADRATFRRVSASRGQQNVLQANMGKKPRSSTVAQASQIDIPPHQSRRTGGNVSTSGLPYDRNRVAVIHGTQEKASRRPSDGRPPPMGTQK